MQAGLSAAGRAELDRTLRKRFGPDTQHGKDAAVVARVRRRGRILSEREYRIVQAHADAVFTDRSSEAEYLALGALLDAFMAAP
jgi:hypothetical protein